MGVAPSTPQRLPRLIEQNTMEQAIHNQLARSAKKFGLDIEGGQVRRS